VATFPAQDRLYFHEGSAAGSLGALSWAINRLGDFGDVRILKESSSCRTAGLIFTPSEASTSTVNSRLNPDRSFMDRGACHPRGPCRRPAKQERTLCFGSRGNCLSLNTGRRSTELGRGGQTCRGDAASWLTLSLQAEPQSLSAVHQLVARRNSACVGVAFTLIALLGQARSQHNREPKRQLFSIERSPV